MILRPWRLHAGPVVGYRITTELSGGSVEG